MNQFVLQMKKSSKEEVYKAIQDCDTWFINQEREDAYGRTWERSDDLSLVDGMYPNPENYHTGTAGMIPYYLYRYELLNQREDLERAHDVAKRLIATKDNPEVLQSDPDYPDLPLNIYGSLLGEASAVLMLMEVENRKEYETFVLELYEKTFSYQKESGTFFGPDCIPMAGDSGTLLFLLQVSKRFNLHSHDEELKKSAYFLLSQAKEAEGGYKWYGVGSETYWPGIECGTAGVAYALSEASVWLNDKALMEGAEKGAKHLMQIAVATEGDGRLFYVNDKRPMIYYLGHCHGSVGISKFFYSLYVNTKKEEYRKFLEQMVNGIVSTGAPEYHSSGYWNNIGYCCGTAGLLKMFLGLYAAFGDHSYLELARRCVSEIIGSGYRDDGEGLRWYQGYVRVRPWKVHTQNGQIIGNAGIASALMEYELASEKRYRSFRFGEDPYPSRKL